MRKKPVSVERFALRLDIEIKQKDVDLSVWSTIINRTSSLSYDLFKINLDKVGLDYDDTKQLATLYAYIYLCNYSYQYTTRELRENSKKNTKQVDTSGMIGFIRQCFSRLNSAINLKSFEFTGVKSKTIYFKKNGKHFDPETIESCWKSIGLEKITETQWKRLKKSGNKDIVKIYEKTQKVACNDYSAYDRENMELGDYMRPYDVSKEEIKKRFIYEEKVEKFESMGAEDKLKVLSGFLKQNKKNKKLKDELKTCRKMISQLKKTNDVLL